MHKEHNGQIAAAEHASERRHWLEPGRGVYDAHRAAALSGVSAATLHYWARIDLYTPSVSPRPRARLWSWIDLLALRALDWFYKGTASLAPARVEGVRGALSGLRKQRYSREDISRILAISGPNGRLSFQLPDRVVRADVGGQTTLADTLNLVAPYKGAPDLLRPRPRLRIIPGKLHGEPHIAGTRIPSIALGILHDAGYSVEQILAMYPDATAQEIGEAIDFERSLRPVAAARPLCRCVSYSTRISRSR